MDLFLLYPVEYRNPETSNERRSFSPQPDPFDKPNASRIFYRVYPVE
jgi:hypothetical protein